VEEFIATGVDFLAPAVGNVHGEYGPKGPLLDWTRSVVPCVNSIHFFVHWLSSFANGHESKNRLEAIRKQVAGRVRIVLHGTNGFADEVTQRCIAGGVSKINVNKLVLEDYNSHLRARASKLPQTALIDEGVRLVVSMQEHQMDVCGSTGKA
jgi:fructose-bisphosphate aldolase class II